MSYLYQYICVYVDCSPCVLFDDRAKKDKEELDFEIDDKSGKLAHMKTQLDAYRDSLVEQANDDRADHFFTTNSVVLRNAYRYVQLCVS